MVMSTGAQHAPEAIDVDKLQTWLATSVWALVGINLVALLFFIAAMLAPQIEGVLKRMAEARAKAKAEADAAAALKAKNAPAETPAATPTPATSKEEVPVAAATPAPAAAEAPKSPTATPTEAVAPPPPPSPASAAPPPAPAPANPEAFEGKTEILTAGQAQAAAAAKAPVEAPATPTPPTVVPEGMEGLPVQLSQMETKDSAVFVDLSFEPDTAAYQAAVKNKSVGAVKIEFDEAFLKNLNSDLNSMRPNPEKTEIIVKQTQPEKSAGATPQALSADDKSVENDVAMSMGDSTFASANDFEKSLDQMLNAVSSDATEEIPIFNVEALDDSIKDATEVIVKKSPTKSGETS